MACCAETCATTCGACPSGLPTTIALSAASLSAVQTMVATCVPTGTAGTLPEWDGTFTFNAGTCDYAITETTISGKKIRIEWTRTSTTFALGANKCAWQFVFRYFNAGTVTQLTGFFAKCDPSPVGNYITNFNPSFSSEPGCAATQFLSLDIV
jgi:hypothetical protein